MTPKPLPKPSICSAPRCAFCDRPRRRRPRRASHADVGQRGAASPITESALGTEEPCLSRSPAWPELRDLRTPIKGLAKSGSEAALDPLSFEPLRGHLERNPCGAAVRARNAGLSFRQARLAQAIEEVLGILGALERGQSCLRADRPCGLDPQ